MSLILSRNNGEELQLVTENNEVVAITLTNAQGTTTRISFDAHSPRRKMNRELIEDVAASPAWP